MSLQGIFTKRDIVIKWRSLIVSDRTLFFLFLFQSLENKNRFPEYTVEYFSSLFFFSFSFFFFFLLYPYLVRYSCKKVTRNYRQSQSDLPSWTVAKYLVTLFFLLFYLLLKNETDSRVDSRKVLVTFLFLFFSSFFFVSSFYYTLISGSKRKKGTRYCKQVVVLCPLEYEWLCNFLSLQHCSVFLFSIFFYSIILLSRAG